MSRPPKAFDVWFVTANTVYKQVPFQVVSDWAQEGRLGAADRVRPAGTAEAWKRVDEWPVLADYLPRPAAAYPTSDAATAAAVGAGVAAAHAVTPGPAEVPEPADQDAAFRSNLGDEDDEVDMIPLIDISMVLLVFFIIVSATGALSPVNVPDMKYATGALSNSADGITMTIEKGGPDDIYYTLREGPSPARPDYAHMTSDVEALRALDAVLADRTKPPEVLVSCDKELPSERVWELSRELKKRQEKNKILSFAATVNEAPKDE